MKLASIVHEQQTRIALVLGDNFIDVARHLPDAPTSLIEIITRWGELGPKLKVLEAATPDGRLADVTLDAPIRRPGKIFAIGLNYADHCEEAGMALPTEQIWFTKAPSAINPPYAAVEIPAVSDSLDYEAEMVVVIGKTCRNVPAERFEDVVFGYCVGNDLTIRAWQPPQGQWSLSKSFDTCAAIGPWITTSDEIDPHALDIRSFVNGELRQNSNTRHLVFGVGQMIEHLSKAMTLEPGDLIFTGTTGGVGVVWNGSPHYLAVGDITRVEIDRLGVLEAVVKQGSNDVRIG